MPLLDTVAADVRPATLERELDTRSPLTVAQKFADAISDATLVVIEGAGHVSHLERPAQVNDALRAFCRAHPPSK